MTVILVGGIVQLRSDMNKVFFYKRSKEENRTASFLFISYLIKLLTLLKMKDLEVKTMTKIGFGNYYLIYEMRIQ